MTGPPTLADLMADPGELDVSCLDCHRHATMPAAALLPRYAPDTSFPDTWGGFRCSACGSKRVDVRPNWAARQSSGCCLSNDRRYALNRVRYRTVRQDHRSDLGQRDR